MPSLRNHRQDQIYRVHIPTFNVALLFFLIFASLLLLLLLLLGL